MRQDSPPVVTASPTSDLAFHDPVVFYTLSYKAQYQSSTSTSQMLALVRRAVEEARRDAAADAGTGPTGATAAPAEVSSERLIRQINRPETEASYWGICVLTSPEGLAALSDLIDSTDTKAKFDERDVKIIICDLNFRHIVYVDANKNIRNGTHDYQFKKSAFKRLLALLNKMHAATRGTQVKTR